MEAHTNIRKYFKAGEFVVSRSNVQNMDSRGRRNSSDGESVHHAWKMCIKFLPSKKKKKKVHKLKISNTCQ